MDAVTMTLVASLGVLVLAGIILGIVIWQLGVMHRQQETTQQQTALAQRHLELLEQQARLLADQLARRAGLTMVASWSDAGDGNTAVHLLVHNEGTKTVSDFYWHLYLPVGEVQDHLRDSMSVQQDVMGEVTVDGTRYRHYSGHQSWPLYPTRRAAIGKVLLPRTQIVGLQIRWQIVSEDGKVPADGLLGSISIGRPAGDAS